jgi:histidyl-tRNA synthetase
MRCTPTDFFKVAAHTAEHFGFRTADELRKSAACKNCRTSLPHTITAEHHALDSHNGLLVSGVQQFFEQQLYALERPTLLYSLSEKPGTGEPAVTFQIFNVPRSIAEAILIQAGRAMATELGHVDHLVRLNSLGDSESLGRYTRELTNFLRKRLDTMPATARELMKEHALVALAHLIEQDHDLAYRTPNPLEYLSDQSRKHFREIVEYLDMSDTPYEIDPRMIAHHNYYSDAIFSIDSAGEEPLPFTIRGGRHDTFVHLTTRSRIPAVGAVITLTDTRSPGRFPRHKTEQPSVYVVHLGFGPKIRSLLLIDTLRQAGITVHHDLASDSLSAQLRDAEARNVRYSVIIGQKEFVEQTVILRDMQERNQECIPLTELPKKLKRRTLLRLS